MAGPSDMSDDYEHDEHGHHTRHAPAFSQYPGQAPPFPSASYANAVSSSSSPAASGFQQPPSFATPASIQQQSYAANLAAHNAKQQFQQEVTQFRTSSAMFLLNPAEKSFYQYTPSTKNLVGPKTLEPSIIKNIEANKRMYFAEMNSGDQIDVQKHVDELCSNAAVPDPRGDNAWFHQSAALQKHPAFPVMIGESLFPHGIYGGSILKRSLSSSSPPMMQPTAAPFYPSSHHPQHHHHLHYDSEEEEEYDDDSEEEEHYYNGNNDVTQYAPPPQQQQYAYGL